MTDKLIIYMASATGNPKIKSDLQRAEMILTGKNIEYEKVDVTADSNVLNEMRRIVGDEKATPVQFCRGSKYLGDFDALCDANECGTLRQFVALE